MISRLKSLFNKWFNNMFSKRGHVKLGLYGPPNGGKCVTPETELILANGKVVPIQTLFRETDKLFKKDPKELDAEEYYLWVEDKNIELLSVDPYTLDVVARPITYLYAQKYEGDIYTITTKSGKSIRLTPNHPLLHKISERHYYFTKSSELKVGDLIGSTDISAKDMTSLEKMEDSGMVTLQHALLSKLLPKVAFEEIVVLQKDYYSGYVYDATIQDTHTFLTGSGVVAHNTTLANTICVDWLGEEMGTASSVAHETREIQIKEQISLKSNNKELTFNLVDTPGIATKIDFEEFVKAGMKEGEAKKRAKEATKGVIDAIKWLDDMDAVIVVMDATKDPYSQVNITIIGNLQARDIPVLIVANKLDLKKANLKRVENAFPQYEVVGISAKQKKNIDKLYESLFKLIN